MTTSPSRAHRAFVLVTHDPLDAAALSDTIVIVDAGRVIQQGTPADVARRPASPWVAQLLGVNHLRGRVRGRWFDLGAGLTFPCAGEPEGERWAVLAPRSVSVTSDGADGGPTGGRFDGPVVGWSTRVVSVQPTGDRVLVGLEYPPGLTADVTPDGPDTGRWTEGMPVWASIDPSDLDLYAPPSV